MRIPTVAFCLAALVLPVLAEPPAPAPPPEKIAALVRQLDDDDPGRRDEAGSGLLAIGAPALEALRAAAADEKLGPEGKARAAALIPEIETRQERRRIWGDKPDPVKAVSEELKSKGEDGSNWGLHELTGAALDRVAPKCLFVVADWIGNEQKPVPSELFAVCREPAGIVRLRSASDFVSLAAWFAPAVDGPSKEKIAGVLSGLEFVLRQYFEPFEFRAHAAKAPVGKDGATTYADTVLLRVSFDEKGILKQVSYISELQRGK